MNLNQLIERIIKESGGDPDKANALLTHVNEVLESKPQEPEWEVKESDIWGNPTITITLRSSLGQAHAIKEAIEALMEYVYEGDDDSDVFDVETAAIQACTLIQRSKDNE